MSTSSLNRTLSPAVIAQYQTQLPDKRLLQAKLREFFEAAEAALSAADAEMRGAETSLTAVQKTMHGRAKSKGTGKLRGSQTATKRTAQ